MGSFYEYHTLFGPLLSIGCGMYYIQCFLTVTCSTSTEGVSIRLECPGSDSIPGVDELMCSLDGGEFFECKMVVQ